MVEGGCLIQGLSVGLIECTNYFSLDEQDTSRTAFEADMINLLVGSLAEAKHAVLHNNECFSKNLINIKALYNFGGAADLKKVYDSLESIISDAGLIEKKDGRAF